jgi:hypothetical protein
MFKQFLSPNDPVSSIDGEPVVVQTPPANTPAATPEDWEKKYKGLQRAMNSKQVEVDGLNDKIVSLMATIEELKSGKVSTETQVTKLNGDLQTALNSLKAEQQKVATSSTETERLKLLVKEFPTLAAFETAGLLPSANTVDEMRSKFKAFQETLSQTVGQNVQKTLQGSSIPTGQAAPLALTEDQLFEARMKVAGVKGKEAEFQRLTAQYDEVRTANQAAAKK